MIFNPSVDITSEQRIVVPIEAIFVRNEQPYLYTVEDNKAVPRKVTTASLFGKEIEITDGLSAEDVVILNSRGVKDNEDVEVISNK